MSEPASPSTGSTPGGPITVAITGATGFIGSALARACLARGDAVRILVRSASAGGAAAEALAGAGAHVVVGDLDAPAALTELCDGAEVVLHCAAFMGKRDPELSERVNVEGTRHLLQAAAEQGTRRFVYISSISVYRGTPSESRIFDESIEPYLHPDLNHYSRTKLLGEHLVARFCAERAASRPGAGASGPGLAYTIIRPTNVYGPGCRPWGTSVEQLTGRYHVCFGQVTFDFVHIDDLVDGILALAAHEGARNTAFNLGAEPVELWAFHRHVARRIGAWTIRVPRPIDALVRHGIDGYARLRGEVRSTGYTQRFVYPHDKATRVCGYRPRRSVADAPAEAPERAP